VPTRFRSIRFARARALAAPSVLTLSASTSAPKFIRSIDKESCSLTFAATLLSLDQSFGGDLSFCRQQHLGDRLPVVGVDADMAAKISITGAARIEDKVR
jgi:hypothetical protein